MSEANRVSPVRVSPVRVSPIQGALAGAVVGLGLALIAALADVTLAGSGSASGALRLLAPLGLIVGAVAGAVLALAHGLLPAAFTWLRLLLAPLTVIGVLLFIGRWHDGSVLDLALRSLVSGVVLFVALSLLAMALLRLPQRATGIAAAAGFVVLWGLSFVAGGADPVADAAFPAELPAATAQRPNGVFIVMDTVRADHLSTYGYSRETSPHVTALAAEGVRYDNVLSPGCWTLPTHASFFTGLPASTHGVNRQHQYVDQKFETLAERLQGAGYQTVGLSTNWMLTPNRGYDQGFDVWGNPSGDKPGQKPKTLDALATRLLGGETASGDASTGSSKMHRDLAGWFRDGYDPAKPFFVFLNYIEAHAPYIPLEDMIQWSDPAAVNAWRKRPQQDLFRKHMFTQGSVDPLSSREIGELETMYDDEIWYVDHKIGELMVFLEQSGLDENTLVVLTADHGEHFGENQMFGHQYSLFEPLVGVPLIVRYPGKLAPAVDDRLVQSHAVFPTILDAAGIEWEGRPTPTMHSLLREAPEGDRYAFSEYLQPDVNALAGFNYRLTSTDMTRFMQKLRVVRKDELKLVWRSESAPELYDVSEDPLESRDLAGERPEETRALMRVLDAWVSAIDHYVPPEVTLVLVDEPTEAEIEHLRDLGYVGGN